MYASAVVLAPHPVVENGPPRRARTEEECNTLAKTFGDPETLLRWTKARAR